MKFTQFLHFAYSFWFIGFVIDNLIWECSFRKGRQLLHGNAF